MTSIALPGSVVGKKRLPWAVALFVSLAIVGVIWLVTTLSIHRGPAAVAGEFFTVAPMDLDVTISKDGELQAVNNVDIVSPVEGQSVILDIVKEGEYVKKGDVLVRIDSSDLKQKIETAQLALQQSESDLTAARESKEIQDSANTANLEAAQVDLTVARLDLLQYTEGDYPAIVHMDNLAV